jgi:hypothetical protein
MAPHIGRLTALFVKKRKFTKGLFHITQTDALPSAKPAKAKGKKA